MADPDSAATLQQRLLAEGLTIDVMSGPAGLEAVATHPDASDLMAAIVGAAGLLPTLAAVQAGKRILLANKEALVVSGALFMAEARASGATLLPIDSEHNAVFQCLPADFASGLGAIGVERILLTASGGPFRERTLAELQDVTPEQACAHPNWVMGRKISVDSATMMNKGLEVIEARWLFDARPEQIEVVVHPQSVIHSMVAVRRRLGAGAAGQPGHAHADRACAGLAGAAGLGRSARWICSTWPGWISSRRICSAFPACVWPSRRWPPAARPRRC